MNDFDFARHVTPAVGQLYHEAKRSRHEFPRNTLIAMRSLASLCCDILWDGSPDWPGGLDEKIRVLYRTHRINRDTREQLDQLRRWGNRAAHPEEGLLDAEGQAALAERALDLALALLETVFRQKHAGAAVPAYRIDDTRPDELRDACFRALVEGSAADQHQVAMLLRQRLTARIETLQADPERERELSIMRFEFNAEEERLVDLLRQASDAGYAPARYQYGLVLVEGRRGEDKIGTGAYLIAMACDAGEIDAVSWCGRAAMLGLHGEPVDYGRARSLLERAAAEDHPMALSLLSIMYRDGLGVEPDAAAAFALILRAAEAGFALAQYEAALSLFQGKGVARDDVTAAAWLEQASDSGVPAAQYAQAWCILTGFDVDEMEAERLLVAAASHFNHAHLDLADLYMGRQDPRLWLEAAGRVQAAYERSLVDGDEALAQRCLKTAPPLIAKLEAARVAMPDDVLDTYLPTRFLFDERGRPHPNRRERMLRMIAASGELARASGSGSATEQRLLRELNSLPAAAKQPRAAPKAIKPGPVTQRAAGVRVGRNDPCRCGSGKKSKHCCA